MIQMSQCDNFKKLNMKNEIDIDDEEKVEIQKTFLKMKSNMGKEGYREGIEQGKQTVYQQYFDKGYLDGFRNGYNLGKLKGKLFANFTFNDSNRPNVEALQKSTTAACILCEDENFLSKSISDIYIKQTEVLDNLLSIENNQDCK